MKKQQEGYDPVTGAEAIDVEELLRSMEFSEEQVIDAVIVQPKLFVDAIRYRTAMMRLKNRAKSELEVYRSEKANAFRIARKEIGDRVTESQVNDRLLQDMKYNKLSKAVDRAEEVEEFAKLLVDAFRMRRDAIRIVADLTGAEASMQKALAGNADAIQEVRKKLKSKYKKES